LVTTFSKAFSWKMVQKKIISRSFNSEKIISEKHMVLFFGKWIVTFGKHT
jgi:hypothetical protein